MTHDPNQAENLLQSAAERPAEPTDAADVARYRYVLHAIRQLPVPTPPADFARQVEAHLQDYPEDASAEQWLLRVTAVAAVVLGIATVGPWLATSTASLASTLGHVPWHLLGAMSVGLAAFATFDRLRHGKGDGGN